MPGRFTDWTFLTQVHGLWGPQALHHPGRAANGPSCLFRGAGNLSLRGPLLPPSFLEQQGCAEQGREKKNFTLPSNKHPLLVTLSRGCSLHLPDSTVKKMAEHTAAELSRRLLPLNTVVPLAQTVSQCLGPCRVASIGRRHQCYESGTFLVQFTDNVPQVLFPSTW